MKSREGRTGLKSGRLGHWTSGDWNCDGFDPTLISCQQSEALIVEAVKHADRLVFAA